MPSQRDTIMTRLKRHAGPWITDIPQLKGLMLACHYFSLDNHMGGVMRPAESFTTIEGQVITFKDVPVAKIVQEVAGVIKSQVPEDVRTSVYHKVLKGMPGHQQVPEWDTKSPESLYSNPSTPFSKPRDETFSNEDLLRALAVAAEITLQHARRISVITIHRDATSEGAFGCSFSFDGDVSGGRLGRPHELSDVPTNFFRDRMMNYIAEFLEVNKEKKQAARKAICPDLTDAEIEEYAKLIAEQHKKEEEKERAEDEARCRPLTREEQVEEILECGRGGTIKTRGDALKVLLMREAVENIDDTIDWKRRKPTGIRRKEAHGVRYSVIKPECWGRLVCESNIVPDQEIDRTCDQVRAMIKTFLKSWSWDVEDFRCALLPTMTRERFIAFLNKRGTDSNQIKSPAYQLCWEFFNRREKLGLSLEDVDVRDDMDKVAKRIEDSKRSERERALVAAQEEEKKALAEEHEVTSDALSKDYAERMDKQEKSFVEQLKTLFNEHPRGSTHHSELFRELEKTQREEYDILRKEKDKKKRELSDAYSEEIDALTDKHEKQLADLEEEERLEALRVEEGALVEAQPARLNKRAATGAGGRGRKKARK